MVSVHAESPTTAAPSLRAVLQDFAREADPSAQLVSLSLKRFATLIFGTCPGLGPYSGALDAIYKQFNDYKQVGYVSFERSPQGAVVLVSEAAVPAQCFMVLNLDRVPDGERLCPLLRLHLASILHSTSKHPRFPSAPSCAAWGGA